MRERSILPRGFRAQLTRRARRAGLTLSSELSERLAAYVELLNRWNQRINLTGLTDTDAAIDRLLLEPLAAARHVPQKARTMIDVGSGGGSPAIPLKLAVPELSLTMVESKARKSAFLREAIRALDLSDSRVETARYEELLSRPDLHESFDVLTLRAVRIDARSMGSLEAFVRPGGIFLLFTGADSSIVSDLPPDLSARADVPLIESLRSRLIVVDRRASR